MPYFLSTECGLPQILHLVYARVEYFGFLCCFTLRDVFAIFPSLLSLKRHAEQFQERLPLLRLF